MSDIWPTAFVNVICNCELIEDVSNSIGKDFADQLCTLHYVSFIILTIIIILGLLLSRN